MFKKINLHSNCVLVYMLPQCEQSLFFFFFFFFLAERSELLSMVCVNKTLFQAWYFLLPLLAAFNSLFLVIHCFFHVLGEIFGFMIASQTCCCLGLNLKLIPLLLYLLFPVL